MNNDLRKKIIIYYSKIHTIIWFFSFLYVCIYGCVIIIPNVTLSLKNINLSLYETIDSFRGIFDWILIGLTYYLFQKFNNWFDKLKKSIDLYD
jgi:hypothetical protein